MDNKLKNNVAVVTGAAKGIGLAIAERLASDGARLVLADLDQAGLDQAAADLASRFDTEVATQSGDLADQEIAGKTIKLASDRFGRLDILVNNAGVVPTGPLLEASVADWRKVMAIDVDGVFFCTRAALPHLIRSGGNIVNVSSVSGLGGDWNMSFYNAAKGAVSNFTRSLALELGERGVRVNAVNPGLTFTDLTEDMKGDTALMKRFAERIPLGRGAEPDEVADVIAFLASEDARYVTGVNLPVDGGLTASNGQPKQA